MYAKNHNNLISQIESAIEQFTLVIDKFNKFYDLKNNKEIPKDEDTKLN